MTNEEKFYEALKDVFTGESIQGRGGFVNLLRIKNAYYKEVLAQFEHDVKNCAILQASNAREDFFDHLYSFFSKYFSESGSVYYCKTAYSDKKYERVYTDNKDVMLFWKTNMLYYVKSDIMYKNIIVEVEQEEQKIKFAFDCSDIQGKQNNEKKEIIFDYIGFDIPKFIDGEKSECHILKVSYSQKGRKTKTDEIAKKAEINEEIIKKTINVFNKQSSVDFFINKNAKKFLTEQLDLYIHQVLLDEQNEFDSSALQRFKIFKDFALKLIDFISQFEQELVRIWNKPKFVLNSNYVITLDRLPKEIIDKIAVSSGLKKQIEEWQTLGIVDGNFDFNNRNNEEKYAHLPIDTKYFKDIEEEILALFDNLDEALDGRLIHSENYQALNTLKERYKGQVQCIYIDPPFNTGKDFAYIDGYQDSTWLSIMRDRIDLLELFLSENSNFYLHLDYRANYLGRMLLAKYFNEESIVNEIIWRFGWVSGYKAGEKVDSFHRNHQTIFRAIKGNGIFYSDKSCIQYTTIAPKDKKNEIKEFLSSLGLDIKDIKIDTSKIIFHKKDGSIIKFDKNRQTGFKGSYPYEDIWNTGDYDSLDPVHSVMIQSFSNEKVKNGKDLTQKPEKLLKRILDVSTKEKDYIMDIFLGSGPTVRSALKMKRKFLGVELDDSNFYDTVLLTMKEAAASNSNREPTGITTEVNWQGGGFFKYYDLEQYESTLSKMKYSEISPVFYKENPFENYVFLTDSKLADVLEFNDKDVSLDFNRLYENIDFAETISLLKGLPIKKIVGKKVILSDNTEYSYDFAAMNNEEKIKFAQMLKPLLWWGE